MGSKRPAEDGDDHDTEEKRPRPSADEPVAPVANPEPGPPPPPVLKIDRTKKCPLLLRIFPQLGAHHRLTEYQELGRLPKNEIQVHTWMDADLRELSDLVKETNPAARNRNARIEFALVFPDKRGRNIMRLVGEVDSEKPGPDDSKTLQQIKFQTGDFMDVAIRTENGGAVGRRDRPAR